MAFTKNKVLAVVGQRLSAELDSMCIPYNVDNFITDALKDDASQSYRPHNFYNKLEELESLKTSYALWLANLIRRTVETGDVSHDVMRRRTAVLVSKPFDNNLFTIADCLRNKIKYVAALSTLCVNAETWNLLMNSEKPILAIRYYMVCALYVLNYEEPNLNDTLGFMISCEYHGLSYLQACCNKILQESM